MKDNNWYFLDPDNNKKDPKGLHCCRCKRSIKATMSFESFLPVVLHPENPWVRLASPAEKSVLIGSHCFEKIKKEWGIQSDTNTHSA